jgi:ATP-dependent Clp protease ATP-binding subunit ClpB
MKEIADIQLNIAKERLKDRKIDIELSPGARDFIAEKGFSPEYGARPLKRTIQRLIINPLSVRILNGEFKEGDRITIDIKARKIAFNKKGG